MLAKFYHYFTNIGKSVASKLPEEIYFKISPTDPVEVSEIINIMKANTVLVFDGLSTSLMQGVGQEISEALYPY